MHAKLGVDIGGTRVKVGLVAHGRVVKQAVVDMGCTDADALVSLIHATAEKITSSEQIALTSAGVGVAGVLGPGGDVVLESPNMPWLNGTRLAQALQRALGVPVRCDNDANCVGWGEAVAGAGRDFDDQLCLALGTGVGGSLVIGGRLYHGTRGRGPELGHINVELNGPTCGCGGRGCLEQYASKTGLLRLLADYGVDYPATDPVVALFDASRRGDAVAVAIIREAGSALGRGVMTLSRFFGVHDVILAGGLAGAADLWLPMIQETLDRHSAAPVRVVTGQLGAAAGVIGAALLSERR